ncbi:MAG: glycerol-3-phosphate acyltransferase [Chlorobi bacterium OLB4]|nr:MAG: glycerol-3-phosphate acyltransferase [Chlorobi bacterium OLB4]MBW7854983.1 glycerol-3-phosphate 1-O-acyltransferase PlsY [Ignavibacteria bacterium]OQY76832.1 MAG: acyl-phosphate glycerol 3-phosphate acyltransferase [Ignavibacteriales bacterium UTCHB1]
MLSILIMILVSYLIGSIPFAYIVGKLFKGIDLREYGSGNLGSTNAFRVLGTPLGILVQVLDITKGLVAVLFVSSFFYSHLPFANHTPFEDITLVKIIAGVSAILGHTFSIFVSFKGGKGINTALGMLISLSPVDVSISLGFFVLILISSGYVSLGSIVASFSLPVTMFIRENFFHVEINGYGTLIFFTIAISVFLIYNHRTNIIRLLRGNENRFESLWLIRVCKIKAPLAKK